MSNLRSALPRRRRPGCAMAAYDSLPPPLRRWVMQAALPWSAASVQRLWDRAVRQARGDLAAALARLDAAEQRCLARDQPSPFSPLLPPTTSQPQGLRR